MGYQGEKNAKGERHGFGRFTFPPEACFAYTGQWDHGHIQGPGVLRVSGPSSNSYSNIECNFTASGEINGYGTRTWYESDVPVKVYRGEFRCGESDGSGELYSQTESYLGEFSRNAFNGRGTRRVATAKVDDVTAWENGKVECITLEGEWRNHKLHGQGKEISPDGHVFVGTFSDGLRCQGDGQWSGGGCYSGTWNGCMRHGTGEYACAQSGITYAGQWENDAPIGRSVELMAAFIHAPSKADATKPKGKKVPPPEQTTLAVHPGDTLPSFVVRALSAIAVNVSGTDGDEAQDDLQRVATGESGRKLRVTIHKIQQESDGDRLDDARSEFLMHLDASRSKEVSDLRSDDPDSGNRIEESSDGESDEEVKPATEYTFGLAFGEAVVNGLSLPAGILPGAFALKIADASQAIANSWSHTEAIVFPECRAVILPFRVDPA